ncbi:prostacyclin receptor isoform X2 [Mugil cephalus]|uniref:prostacyclin receptor isoform X2 n=1 Tax=Mugil cephalus TaxID=48193 RepID=UPI001FB5A269|nr:prostacyclin receptor isoform X2 [Mugil cephalus]
MQCNSSVSAPFTNYSGGLEGKPVTTTIMFLAGVVGNLLALFILGVHQKENRARSSVFCILVTGLALTDLLGTCILSPPVFICYAKNRTLIQLGGETLCNLFGFAMSFFGLAPTLILCAMAVERMYCPGTWCFIRMDPREDDQTNLVLAFSLSYSSLMALLIFAVFVCNGSVIVSLCQMHRSQIMRRSSVGSTGRKKRLSLARFGRGEEEVDHLVLLVLITVIFVVCSLPLTIAGFINAIHPFCSDDANLTAFRFYAVNPIVDPWVFIICRKSVFRHLCSVLSCRFSKGAVKTTTHCTLSLPLDNVIRCNPREVTVPQSNMYPSVPL